jgi:hypothetical protein
MTALGTALGPLPVVAGHKASHEIAVDGCMLSVIRTIGVETLPGYVEEGNDDER